RFDGDKNRAMAHAISNTFKSVAGSSVTTIAGFLALCFMTFTLGMNIGVVMAKGVVLGVLSCITVLPAFILTFDKLIDKTTHKPLVPNLEKISNFIMKYHIGFIVVFLLLIFPAVYGNNHVNVYYNMDKTLPADLPSSQANTKLDEKFGMNAMHLVMIKNDMSAKDKMKMIDEMKKVDGVKWVVGLNSIVGPAVPESMIPSDVKKMLKSDNNEIMFVSSDYKTATDEVNAQIDELNGIVKKYSETNMVIGEAPLTKDLINITAVDFRNVSIVSIGAIFIIILIVFKSVSLPIILVSVIEFSILVNMAVSYYTGVTLPFIASIVIGTIQLGATVDYAILMTSKYQKHRNNGLSKKESISLAHKSSMKSILISGLSFFAATFGVGMYSEIDMISSLCTLLSRGAIISTIVVIFVLPALFMIFDPIICKTSIGFGPKKSSI
ncbi:MAG: uncharacterized protein PWP24_1026, partial [Clostridiales bacterium]|nr:uncharacterized protein [Clostridiales bacterium]